MTKTVLKLDGMACGMCESHVNDAIRRSFPVKKVTSSHRRGECVIESETALDEAALRAALAPTGYRVLSVTAGECERRGGLFRRK